MAATNTAPKGSKPDKIIRDALILELNRMTDAENGEKVKKVNRIVAKLVSAGMEGKVDAIREIFDRVEGKAKQELDVHHEGELTLKSALVSQLDSFFAQPDRPRLENRPDPHLVSN